VGDTTPFPALLSSICCETSTPSFSSLRDARKGKGDREPHPRGSRKQLSLAWGRVTGGPQAEELGRAARGVGSPAEEQAEPRAGLGRRLRSRPSLARGRVADGGAGPSRSRGPVAGGVHAPVGDVDGRDAAGGGRGLAPSI